MVIIYGSMGWVPGFDHDLFLSYARVDDATVGDEEGWVTQLRDHLIVALGKKIGRLNAAKIWRDTREIDGNQLFDQTIQDAIRRSAVFVALSSNGYFLSDYCRQELDWFYRTAQSDAVGLLVGDKSRIVNLLLYNISRDAWPKEYGRTSGFAFHDSDEADRAGEPSGPSSPRFHAQLAKLAEALCDTLSRMRDRAVAPVPPPKYDLQQLRVYFADTPDTLTTVRKRVLNELKQSAAIADIQMATSLPPPFEAAAHDAKVRAELELADLSVHLLDVFPGREVIDEEGSFYPQRQVELAKKHGASQLIWVPQGLTLESIEDRRHAEFLDALENGPREKNARYDFQRELPSAITRQILAKVEELKARRASRADTLPDATLLDTHIKDHSHALKVGQYLQERNILPYINPQEDDPAKHLNLLSERLKQVNILIIFYGAVTAEWVRARLAHALQIAVAEACPLRACGVYVAPPHKTDGEPELTVPFLPVEWMDHTGGFDAGAIERLLARARGDRP